MMDAPTGQKRGFVSEVLPQRGQPRAGFLPQLPTLEPPNPIPLFPKPKRFAHACARGVIATALDFILDGLFHLPCEVDVPAKSWPLGQASRADPYSCDPFLSILGNIGWWGQIP